MSGSRSCLIQRLLRVIKMPNDILVIYYGPIEIFDIRAAVEKYSKHKNISYRTSKESGEIRVFIGTSTIKIVSAQSSWQKLKGYHGTVMMSGEFIEYLNDLQKEKT